MQYRATSSNGKSATATLSVYVKTDPQLSNIIGSTTGTKTITFTPSGNKAVTPTVRFIVTNSKSENIVRFITITVR